MKNIKKSFFSLFLCTFIFSSNFNANIEASGDDSMNRSTMMNNIKKVTLQNGMTVLVFKNSSTPKVLAQIVYDVGSYVEQSGERGLAHLIEHMIFKGTEKLSEGDIAAIANKYGATLNAFTSNDMTSYFFEVDKNNWQHFIPILADCMQNARFDEQHLASELLTVIQELKMRKDSYGIVAWEKICELIYPAHHPYHSPLIGYKEDLANVSAQDLKNFYKKYYGPERATLFIVGDVDIDEAVQLARQNFENIENENSFDVSKIQFPQVNQNIVTNQTSIYENVQKEEIAFYWSIPGLKAKKNTLVSVISFIFGQGQGSRLYKRLVDEEKIATNVFVGASPLMEEGIFVVSVAPVDGKSEQCRQVVKQELEKLISEGVTDQELEKVVKTEKRVFFQKMQSLGAFTSEWISSYFESKDELAILGKSDEFGSIDSKQIQDFTSKYLNPFFMGQIQILPLPEDKKDVWQEAKNNSDQLDKQILSNHVRETDVEDPTFVKNMPDPNKLDFVFPKPDKDFELENGLRVLLCRNGDGPILSINCRFRDSTLLGSSKDSDLMSLLMNMLIEGSDSCSKEDNIKFFESFGASFNFSIIGGGLSILSDDSQLLFERFFHVLTNPSFPVNALEKLKKISIDNVLRSKDNPMMVAFRLLINLIYKEGHPYHWEFDEAIELIKNIEIKKLNEVHKKYVNPKNMILTVVGNFDLDQMEKTVKNIFGNWVAGEFVKNEFIKVEFEENQTASEHILRDQSSLMLGQPNDVNIYHPDATALKLLNTICFGSMGSRLYQLREQTGLFYMAFGAISMPVGRIDGFDFVYALLSPDKVDIANQKILDLINEFARDGIKQEELDAAIQQFLKGLIDYTSNNTVIADFLNSIASYDLDFDYYDKALREAQNLTVAQLNEVAKKHFTTEKLATVKVGRI